MPIPAKYCNLNFTKKSLLDANIEAFDRASAVVVGKLVGNETEPPVFAGDLGYNLSIQIVGPGKGNALHSHDDSEIFVPLCGRWEFWCGETEDNMSVTCIDISMGDQRMIKIPAGWLRRYENCGSEDSVIVTFLVGPPKIYWERSVIEAAIPRSLRPSALSFFVPGTGERLCFCTLHRDECLTTNGDFKLEIVSLREDQSMFCNQHSVCCVMGGACVSEETTESIDMYDFVWFDTPGLLRSKSQSLVLLIRMLGLT